MTVKICSEELLYHPAWIEDEVQELQYVTELWTDLSNRHGGFKCTATTKLQGFCDGCDGLTGDPYACAKLLAFINMEEWPKKSTARQTMDFRPQYGTVTGTSASNTDNFIHWSRSRSL